jgi:hypothetical protein
VDAQPASGQGGGDTEEKARQQKSEDRDATPNLFLKHPEQHLQHTFEADETHETCM